jgi:hypothetical protein
MLSPAYRSHLVRVTETEPLSELVWAIRKDPDNERGKYTTEQKIRMSRHRHEGAPATEPIANLCENVMLTTAAEAYA